MPPLPSRQSLEAMKRADLQRLCKDYGVRANLKSEALIDLLLDTQSQPIQPSYNTRRSVSIRHSSKAGPSRISSVIIHDTDDEADNRHSEEDEQFNDAVAKLPQPPIQTRTRKAKELQTRLGVGRPVVAGGAGARAVTKSLSVSRSRRGKPSRSLKPVEATILEEPEDTPPSVTETQPIFPQSSKSSDQSDNATQEAGVLQRQIETLKLELEKTRHLSTEVEYLRKQLASVAWLQQTVDGLVAEVQQLREESSAIPQIQAELKELKETWVPPRTPPNPSTPKSEAIALQPPPSPGGFGDSLDPSNAPLSSIPEVLVANSPTMCTLPLTRRTVHHPSSTVGILGKRHRDSSEGTSLLGTTRNDESSSETEHHKSSMRPTKKRLKMTQDHPDARGSGSSPSQSGLVLDSTNPASSYAFSSTPRPASFKVFQGPEDSTYRYSGTHPPTGDLPDFFGAPSPIEDMLLDAATAIQNPSKEGTASENQNQFNFSLLPPSSTPNSSLYMPNFPYPDPPQSPSPAGMGTIHHTPGHAERTDPFKNFGLPSPTRRKTSESSSSQQQEFVNPVALTRNAASSSTGSGDSVTSNDVAAGLGLTASSTSASQPTGDDKRSELHPTRRTMYGTELEGDTRFGDFGVKGVASGFWTGGRF